MVSVLSWTNSPKNSTKLLKIIIYISTNQNNTFKNNLIMFVMNKITNFPLTYYFVYADSTLLLSTFLKRVLEKRIFTLLQIRIRYKCAWERNKVRLLMLHWTIRIMNHCSLLLFQSFKIFRLTTVMNIYITNRLQEIVSISPTLNSPVSKYTSDTREPQK